MSLLAGRQASLNALPLAGEILARQRVALLDPPLSRFVRVFRSGKTMLLRKEPQRLVLDR